ncbi:L domain-like protein [Rhizoclosmatium globosum]|uniref:L domain-like protein n=1 Tax=Rhizoclosmatium globosum TaxID=329046 RepID=A0A1Y2CGI8_9FUNG|nr:L domain-like protein [Rhizoclosmatium globosum]|eukprot:ORY46122.1 L domain-like protein [Rhizoclosmatium globosum]
MTSYLTATQTTTSFTMTPLSSTTQVPTSILRTTSLYMGSTSHMTSSVLRPSPISLSASSSIKAATTVPESPTTSTTVQTVPSPSIMMTPIVKDSQKAVTIQIERPADYPECKILVNSFPSVQYPFDCSSIDPNGKYDISKLKIQRRQRNVKGSRDESKYVLFENFRVKEIVLPRLGLSQIIPASIYGLGSLNILDLSGNQITGGIPTTVGLLTNLKRLKLAGNAITGSIPPQLGKLANLQLMDLSSNQLTGGIPPQLSQLSNLQSITLADNQISGVIPPVLAAAIAAKGASLNVGTNCLSGSANQRTACNRKKPDCRAISLDDGYADSRWTPLWNALAVSENDMNAFDNAVNTLGFAHFGVREYEFQAFRYYAARRVWCMLKHPEYVYLG